VYTTLYSDLSDHTLFCHRFESCGPQLFHIVQVQLSFVAIPVQGNNYKMLVVLCLMALLDGTLRKVHVQHCRFTKGNTLSFTD